MPDPDRLSDRLAHATPRRGFLERVGRLLVGVTAAPTLAAALAPQEAEAYHFCGHTFTTGSCPHPTGLPRVDARGLPLRARDGWPVDDLGRPIDRAGRPVNDQGNTLRDPDGRPLPAAPRTPICRGVGSRYGMRTSVDGSWYRCCGGHVRRLMDCCSYSSRRINGDDALTGYCYSGRKVFCVHYYDTRVPC
jgi:hypothetical protein